MADNFDLVVIGAGPGGYTAALRAAALGRRVAMVEKERVGGVCLNWGCIPTKAMLHSAGVWRSLRTARRFGIHVENATFDYPAIVRRSRQTVDRLVKGLELLLRDAGVETVLGTARLDGREGDTVRVQVTSSGGDGRRLGAARVILATGGAARSLPGMPFDGERILSSREAVVLQAPPERMLIIGAGAIGLEFADLFATFGARVTVVEMLPQILPLEDEEIAGTLRDALTKRGIRVRTGSVVSRIERAGGALRCFVRPTEEGPEESLDVDAVLVAVGVTGVVEGLGLGSVGIDDAGGILETDAYQQTAVPGIYAIGDVAGPPQLAHAAAAQGDLAAEHMCGQGPRPFDSRLVPGAVFTHPQVASVGLREQDLRDREGVGIGRFPFSASGKAVAEGEVSGMVKILVDEKTGRILGAHIVGPSASELIAELTLAAQAEIPAREILGTIHTHPTLAEAVAEAVGASIHA